jgi:hypothetical protein
LLAWRLLAVARCADCVRFRFAAAKSDEPRIQACAAAALPGLRALLTLRRAPHLSLFSVRRGLFLRRRSRRFFLRASSHAMSSLQSCVLTHVTCLLVSVASALLLLLRGCVCAADDCFSPLVYVRPTSPAYRHVLALYMHRKQRSNAARALPGFVFPVRRGARVSWPRSQRCTLRRCAPSDARALCSATAHGAPRVLACVRVAGRKQLHRRARFAGSAPRRMQRCLFSLFVSSSVLPIRQLLRPTGSAMRA